jgi:hypothetical protein
MTGSFRPTLQRDYIIPIPFMRRGMTRQFFPVLKGHIQHSKLTIKIETEILENLLIGSKPIFAGKTKPICRFSVDHYKVHNCDESQNQYMNPDTKYLTDLKSEEKFAIIGNKLTTCQLHFRGYVSNFLICAFVKNGDIFDFKSIRNIKFYLNGQEYNRVFEEDANRLRYDTSYDKIPSKVVDYRFCLSSEIYQPNGCVNLTESSSAHFDIQMDTDDNDQTIYELSIIANTIQGYNFNIKTGEIYSAI